MLLAGLLIAFAGCPTKQGSGVVEEEGAHAEHDETGPGHVEHGEHDESAPGHVEHGEHDESAEGHAVHSEGEGGHEGHDHAELIQLSPEQMAEFGVDLATAQAGSLDLTLTLPGEAAVNEDKTGHVLPKLGGIVQKVTKNIGDSVRKGDLLAVIESRDLASAKADYLAARERLNIAESTRDRERDLFEKGVSPEQDYINAQNAVREVEIEVRAAEQALHALGVSHAQLDKLVANPEQSMTRFEVYAPISGRILEKHVSLGESVSTESEMFMIADLSSIWVNLRVSQKDLPKVREGQQVHIRFSAEDAATGLPDASGIPDASGTIKYIDALVAEDTRTATARVVLDNSAGHWKPGMFVTGIVAASSANVGVLVPLDAVINFEGVTTVFVSDEHGFEPRTVTLGRQSATHAEVLSGLKAGERYVSEGAFMVKAELGKSEASHGH
jgi:cobalt-zinc-cadmium efflux system membrane fusion protein